VVAVTGQDVCFRHARSKSANAARHGVSAQCVRHWLAKGIIRLTSRDRVDPELSEQMLEARRTHAHEQPASKPAANAHRPNVQAETMRTRFRRSSCEISWDRCVIAAAPCGGR
jgi:hypothetical protein